MTASRAQIRRQTVGDRAARRLAQSLTGIAPGEIARVVRDVLGRNHALAVWFSAAVTDPRAIKKARDAWQLLEAAEQWKVLAALESSQRGRRLR